ncbi:hypothetical protein LCGC14_0103780 [marine sediment metagenome]|uniref:Uncharacterized protein n=1 Tax=marine sediment metagenome TaxID=412755 RepID=A0A0F9YEP9_9ZZZZ
MRKPKEKKVIIAMSPRHRALNALSARSAGQAGRFKKKKKVLVAMSGGVDSSVATAILKKAGFEVVGVFMRFWRDPVLQRWNRCCSPEAEKRARRVALLLGIPFYVLDFGKEFKKRIVNYFLKEHKKNFTPNPCVVCNKEIKFGLLLEKALDIGADYVATGHYVKKQETRFRPVFRSKTAEGDQGPGLQVKNKIYKLLRAKDKEKDQSYFLWQLSQKQLKKILFPLENLTKKEVISLARKFKLPVLNIPESQEICFIQTTVNDFLKRYLKQKPGPIVEQAHYRASKIIDAKRKIIGQHQGLAFYTIGQRRGIRLPGGPYFVLDKDLKRNFLVVTKNERDLYKKELVAGNVHWISGKKPKLPLRVKSKVRYRQEMMPAIIKDQRIKNKKQVLVEFKKPQRAITLGQSVVFYREKELLGGGIIKKI